MSLFDDNVRRTICHTFHLILPFIISSDTTPTPGDGVWRIESSAFFIKKRVNPDTGERDLLTSESEVEGTTSVRSNRSSSRRRSWPIRNQ